MLNPLPQLAGAVAAAGRRLLIDAMSSFGLLPLHDGPMGPHEQGAAGGAGGAGGAGAAGGALLPFDALAASGNKALQGSPGVGFVIAREAALVGEAAPNPDPSPDPDPNPNPNPSRPEP